ncbi:MAG TPA: alkaline phosphatase family protein [Gemmatimonadaceae bacterium]|nr:alkaline phosphatase family protein [Gemmatimonadaceae bacterium]
MIRIHHLILAVALLVVTVPLSAQRRPAQGTPRPLPDPARAPTLIVFITVDQLRPDYFDRWRTQLTGGLGRLARGGAFYTNAFQDHALTETAPGHATTMSGRFPRRTGIVRNSAGVQDPQQPLIGARGSGASPFRFRGTTLTDWLRSKNPRSRALSVSGKDRGAILPIGRDAQQVFWYASPGLFTTSTYYADTLPDWIRRFNDRRLPDSMIVTPWTLLMPESAYAEPDSVPDEANGRDFRFPHVAANDPDWGLPATPFYDELTLAVALEGLRALDLGTGPQTDVLAISLSATDYIGHKYGPDSREVHDQILRLDRAFGSFLDSLFVLRDSTKVIVALTADHGVASFPEVHTRRSGEEAFHVDVMPVVSRVRAQMAARGGDSTALQIESGMVFLERRAMTRAKINADSLLRALARSLVAIPGVARVNRPSDLGMRDTTRDASARRWLHTIPPDLPVELVITLRPFSVWKTTPRYAEHGSPNDYDAHVPVILYGPPFSPGRRTRPARVVDLAPTLAWAASVVPLEPLDGRVLWDALR